MFRVNSLFHFIQEGTDQLALTVTVHKNYDRSYSHSLEGQIHLPSSRHSEFFF
jgi:hypothetical protein